MDGGAAASSSASSAAVAVPRVRGKTEVCSELFIVSSSHEDFPLEKL